MGHRACHAGTAAALELVEGEPTGRCAVLVCGGERALAGLPGAARSLSQAFVEAAAPRLVDAAAVVYIDTFALVAPKRAATALWLAERATATGAGAGGGGAKLALNLQSANLLKFNQVCCPRSEICPCLC